MAGIKSRTLLWVALAAMGLVMAALTTAPSRLPKGAVMSAAVSTSGRYIITAHQDHSLILWDLEHKTWDTVSTRANIYSAGVVPDRDAILWQDLDNRVVVQTVAGDELLRFDHFPTYGHVISSDLNTYLSADQQWNVFKGFGDRQKPILKDGVSPSFAGSGKLLNLAMAKDRPYFITAGFGDDHDPIEDYAPVADGRRFSRYGGVTLWNTETGEPVAKLRGNSSKTHAAISPDGQWVVSGDENGIGLYWNTTAPEQRYRLARYHLGIFVDDTPYEPGDPRNRNKSMLIEAPSGARDNTLAVAFIDHSQYYLRFGNNSHIAALFETGSPWPVKYFDLGAAPELVTYGSQYSRNTAIATAPEAGVLVMGHRSGGGISVYRFNAEALTLERIWVAE